VLLVTDNYIVISFEARFFLQLYVNVSARGVSFLLPVTFLHTNSEKAE